MGSNNILVFPDRFGNRAAPPPSSPEQVEESVQAIREHHVESALMELIPLLFEGAAAAGFEPEDEFAMLKDGALVVEALRSFMLKIHGINHPLQLIANAMFTQTDDDGTLEVTDNVKVLIVPPQPETPPEGTGQVQ